MIKASALYIVIVISLILAVLCSSFILLAFFYRQEITDHQVQVRLEDNFNSALNLIMAGKISEEGTYSLDLFADGKDSVAIRIIQWGAYQVGYVQTRAGSKKISKGFMFGYTPGKISTSALYLADYNRPLSICGKTVINGECYLPQSGVQRAYIGGRGFEGAKLVNGNINYSKSDLPEINQKLLTYLKEIVTGNTRPEWKRLSSEDFQSLTVSFADSAVYHIVQNDLYLNKKLEGQIIIASARGITVGANAILDNVILLAPYIRFEDQFTGQLQAFAVDSILTGRNVRLRYPSVVGLFPPVSMEKSFPFISLGENAEIKGLVFAVRNPSNQREPVITIGKNAVVEGQVYSEGYLENKGMVKGHAATSRVILKTYGSIYLNHLLDATFDYQALNKRYVGTALLPYESQKKLIRWVY